MIPLPEPKGILHDAFGNAPLTFAAAPWPPSLEISCSTSPVYTADQLRAYGDARAAELLEVAKRRADHEASAAAHHSGSWYEAHQHHLSAHKAMRDLIDAVWPDAGRHRPQDKAV